MRKKRNNKKKARNDTSNKARKTQRKKNTARKSTTPKTRNNGRFTEAQFWQFVRAALRNRTRFWGPRLEALKQARRASQSKNKRLKWEFQCSQCKEWFPQTQVKVHHIKPAGSLNSAEDLPTFVENLFCEVEGLVVVCKKCHKDSHKEKT
jgi:hypothetical protein